MRKIFALSVASFPIFFLLGGIDSDASENRITPVVKVVSATSPSVVNIRTKHILTQRRRLDFFAPFFGQPNFSVNHESYSLGSGVIIEADGLIITNNHVIDGASEVQVGLSDKSIYNAEVIGVDARSDIAIIKIDAGKLLPIIKLGNSDEILIGETVVAIGNPFGLSSSVTRGVISASKRDVQVEADLIYRNFVQIDAPINPGNSGGALLNIDGELIGITTAIYDKAEGIGFAIPINRALKLAKDLISYGKVAHGWIGLITDDIGVRDSSYYQSSKSDPDRLLVRTVFDHSPASMAGIKPGDMITLVDGNKPKSKEEFAKRIVGLSHSDKLELSLSREKNEFKVTLVAAKITTKLASKVAMEWLGLKVELNNEAIAKTRNLYTKSGLIIKELSPSNPLRKVGVKTGDIIRKINKSKITNFEDYHIAVMEAVNFNSALLFIQRGPNIYQISYSG
ncbi:MAG: trypsin-like peptidase domain-containing protein [Nitrospinota bacterium]